jgi:hypothetical protein
VELELKQKRKEAEVYAAQQSREAEENALRQSREAEANALRPRREAERDAKEDEIREQELLALENEQLQARSESWIRNQQAIQEVLIIKAGAEAEAAAIIEETNSRTASPNLGLGSLTTKEKINRFLGTPEPEECSHED